MINSVGQVVSLVFFPYGLAASGSEQVGNGSQPQVRALQGQKENNILEGSFQEKEETAQLGEFGRAIHGSIRLEWLSIQRDKIQGSGPVKSWTTAK